MILGDSLGCIKLFYTKGVIGAVIQEKPSSSVLGPVQWGSDLAFPNPLVAELERGKSAFCPNKKFIF